MNYAESFTSSTGGKSKAAVYKTPYIVARTNPRWLWWQAPESCSDSQETDQHEENGSSQNHKAAVETESHTSSFDAGCGKSKQKEKEHYGTQ